MSQQPMATDFGSGFDLDENWDFYPSETGDVASSSGADQLLNDLAVIIGEIGEDFLGSANDKGELTDLQIDIGTQVGGDPRVDTIHGIEIDQEELEEIMVTIDITTVEDEDIVDVIPVN